MDDERAALLASRVAEVRERIRAAAARGGRAAAEITVVAAAKTRRPEEAQALVDGGVRELGHNYVQEAAAMWPQVQGARWRMIGPLQRNKVNQALGLFDSLDTLADEALARRLQERCEEQGRRLEVLLQIRLGGEATKSGLEPETAERFLNLVQQMPCLQCLGLMTMPPPGEVAVTRRFFGELRELAERLRRQGGVTLPVLSMGMTDDYEVAIEEGATHVRLGTALFGPRS
ncbi:MAG: YggS family pyridoxal phosphate-dependent enzyme [Armatimonadetes bacterium]|nr:YggS family pyridoxal phosphate-dependent enzyme [Armatimonadota bacterium]